MYCKQCGDKITDEANYCSGCGELLDTPQIDGKRKVDNENSHIKNSTSSSDTWNPKYPITSVFVAVLLLWAGLYSGRVSDLLIMGIPSILVVPRVRRFFVPWTHDQIGVNLNNRISRIVIGIIYTVFAIMAMMLMIGAAANDPEMSAGGGFGSIIIAYFVSILIVLGVRTSRKLRK